MKQCLKISFSGQVYKGFLQDFIKKHAQELSLEGVVQVGADDVIHIMVCGKREDLEAFIDVLHRGTKKTAIDEISVAPFMRAKDYRGVFRVIE